MTTDAEIEQLIQDKGLTAPRVTPASIEAIIKAEVYFTAAEAVAGSMGKPVNGELGKALGLLTFCVLYLENGFTVTGEGVCASPENFNAEVGRKAARANAVNKLWSLEGYRLKQRLHEMKTAGTAEHSSGPTTEDVCDRLARLQGDVLRTYGIDITRETKDLIQLYRRGAREHVSGMGDEVTKRPDLD